MNTDEIKAELLVLDYDCEPDEITKALNLEPTRIIHKGDIKRADPTGARPPLLYDKNAWVLEFDAVHTAVVEDHILVLLQKLAPQKDSINALAGKYYVELSIYGFNPHASRLAIHLNKETIRLAAELDINLDIDIYPEEG